MLLHPTCEPINLPVETMARVDRVNDMPNSPAPAPFLHFHDVVEVILFGNANGRMICDGRNFSIGPRTAAIVPSMMYHDFVLEDGAKDWVLIQIDAYLVERSALTLGPNCVVLTDVDYVRLSMLAGWLEEALHGDKSEPLVPGIITLLITRLAQFPLVEGQGKAAVTADIERFFPAIERLRKSPGNALPLKEAATLCNLSAAYFSRRFAAVFGCGFADYVAAYRLQLAARHVATTSTPLSTISYDLGFASPSHFAERYRERFGMTPREYRQRVRNGR